MARLCISAGSKTAIDVEVTVVGEGLFRLDEEPLLFLAADAARDMELFPRFGDIIFAERINSTTVPYLGISERGPYRHYDFLVTQQLSESPRLASFLAEVVQGGGRWERCMGGILVLSLPATSPLDPQDFIAKACGGT